MKLNKTLEKIKSLNKKPDFIYEASNSWGVYVRIININDSLIKSIKNEEKIYGMVNVKIKDEKDKVIEGLSVLSSVSNSFCVIFVENKKKHYD